MNHKLLEITQAKNNPFKFEIYWDTIKCMLQALASEIKKGIQY